MAAPQDIHPGKTLTGPFFDEPVRVETVQQQGEGLLLGLVGLRSERFRRVTLHPEDLAQISVIEREEPFSGDGHLLILGVQALTLGMAFEYDPYFGLSISRVDPLPHQLEAVYDFLLKPPRIRFLLADDAGAGKTIMAGLLIRELKLRHLIERVLIVVPANLTFQWQRELKEKFDESFTPIKGYDIRDSFGVNQWLELKQVITSLDLAKRDTILPGLRQVHWDLVIVDEAHRMSWSPPARKTARYALGELLRDSTDHLLLLTATPHKGDPENFSLFLQLLDPDVYADVRSIREAVENRRAPFYLRRTKEAMVYFPERQPDGTWAARNIFTKRLPHTADFKIDGDEDALYRDVTRFVKRQSRKAADTPDDPRARAVGFLMALYQRRLASSVRALRKSLENRANRLEKALKEAQAMAEKAPPDLPTPDEIEEMEEAEREKLERLVEAVTLSRNDDDVRAEVQELREFANRAEAVEAAQGEAKLTKLKGLLSSEGFSEDSSKRLLIFTEFKDTLDYLKARLESWGFRVGCIHGSMSIGSRDEPGSRLWAEQQFKEGSVQVLVATEAAGEGINLQCCHILFNYDIPWNPNRLEQRMGRIHRYGQKEDCLIFNFVAMNTIEGRILATLLDKLQEIRDALDDDAVFNVVGEVLPAAHIEKVLREYYSGQVGEDDLEDRLLRNVDEQRFRSICRNALEGLATKRLNLDMLVERKAKAQERRMVPETIARFAKDAADLVQLPLKPVNTLAHTFDPGRTPTKLHTYERDPDWRLSPLSNRYPRLSTDRETAEKNNLEWVTPGHPLFEALRRHAISESADSLRNGACFHSLQNSAPSRLDFYRARIVDGLGYTVQEKLLAVEVSEDTEPRACDPNILGNMSPAPRPEILPAVAIVPEPLPWVQEQHLKPFLEETRGERSSEIERVAQHVELSLTELLRRADEEIGRAATEAEDKVPGAEGRLAQAEGRHAELMARRERRRADFERQRSLTLQGVERVATALLLPHPEREAPEVRRLQPNPETERRAMETVIAHEKAQGRQVSDIHEQNLGYDVTSLDLASGELRLIEVKGLGASFGSILLTPNERRVAEDRRDCYWLYIVTDCTTVPTLQAPIKDPVRYPWHEVIKVQHYWLEVDAMRQPMQVKELPPEDARNLE